MEVLQEIRGRMDQCNNFSVAALGQTYQVSSKELQADTDARETFATVSTRADGDQQMLMQVATKDGANLGIPTRRNSEDLHIRCIDLRDGCG